MEADHLFETKLWGFLFTLLSIFGGMWMSYLLGHTNGYQKGLQDNPKPTEIHSYFIDDHRLLRFIPGKDSPVVIDLRNCSVKLVEIDVAELKNCKSN